MAGRRSRLDTYRTRGASADSSALGWRAVYRRSGAEGLVPGSRRPHRPRKREWPAAVLAEIRRLREAHPNPGKRKIHPLLRRFCAEQGLRCPAPATIGRLIADAGGLRAIPPRLDNRGRMKRPPAPEAAQAQGFPRPAPGGAGPWTR